MTSKEDTSHAAGYAMLRLAAGLTLAAGAWQAAWFGGTNELRGLVYQAWWPEFVGTMIVWLAAKLQFTIGALLAVGLFSRIALTGASAYALLLLVASRMAGESGTAILYLVLSLLLGLLLLFYEWNEWSLDEVLHFGQRADRKKYKIIR